MIKFLKSLKRVTIQRNRHPSRDCWDPEDMDVKYKKHSNTLKILWIPAFARMTLNSYQKGFLGKKLEVYELLVEDKAVAIIYMVIVK